MKLPRLIKPWSNSKYQLSVPEEHKLTEYELSEPLSDEEWKLNDWYNERIAKQGALLAAEGEITQQAGIEKRKLTPIEKARLTDFAKQRADCELCTSEEFTWLKLRARRGWQKELTDYRWSVEDYAFANYHGRLSASWSGGFNLPTMIEQYERLKTVQSAKASRLSLAQRKLDAIRKKLLQLTQEDSKLFHDISVEKDLGEMRLVILCEVLEKVFRQFMQHIEKDLEEQLHTISSDNESTPVQLVLQDIPNTPKVETAESTSNSTRQGRKNGKHVLKDDQRDASINLDRFLYTIKTADFDEIAKAAGFWPPSISVNTGKPEHANWNVTYSPAKLNAVYDAILEEELWIGHKQDIIPTMSSRLGYPKQRLDNTRPEIYYSAKDLAAEALASILKRKP